MERKRNIIDKGSLTYSELDDILQEHDDNMWEEQHRSPINYGSPERNLVAAILQAACIDASLMRKEPENLLEKDIRRVDSYEALVWILGGEESGAEFSAEWCCGQLDIDYPGFIKGVLRTLGMDGSDVSSVWVKQVRKRLLALKEGKSNGHQTRWVTERIKKCGRIEKAIRIINVRLKEIKGVGA